MIRIIVARDKNGVIGREGQIPWNLPDDMLNFQAHTQGQVVVCGRKTFESFGANVPQCREWWVLSESTDNLGDKTFRTLEGLKHAIGVEYREVYIAGGTSLYNAFTDIADVFHITEILEEFEGDAYYPDDPPVNFNLVDIRQHQADHRHLQPFNIYTYVRYE